MADEDDVDVEGDFDMNIGGENGIAPNLYIDMNELPSKSANLFPEYTQHPWMLEQGWSLDHCTDEKSKAVIEKMLQEEQQYINGRVTKSTLASTSLPKQQHTPVPRAQLQSQRRPWTDEERRTFQKGLDMHGRSWSRIADMIPEKTTQQVKSFGQHYFKIKAREEEESCKKEQKPIVKTQLPVSIQHAIRAVTTAQPTIKISPKKMVTYYNSSSVVWASDFANLSANTKSKKAVMPAPKKISPPKVRRGRPPGRPPKAKDTAHSSKVTKAKSQAATVVKVEEKTESSLIASCEVVRIPRMDDSDADIDIDVDVDDDEEVNNEEVEDSVYRALVASCSMNGMSEDTSAQDADEGVIANKADLDMKINTDGLVMFSDTNNETPISEMASILTADTSSSSDDKPDERHQESEEFEEGSLSKAECTILPPDQSIDDKSFIIDPDFSNLTSPTETDASSISEDDEFDSHPNEFGLLTSLGDIVWLPNPVKAVTLQRDVTSDEEHVIHSEFFTQRPGCKTPDRYLRIRNFILDAWEKCQPQYLNKTSVRPGLKNCGDVNCIGRIHAYLEQIGAINFGCGQVQYMRTCRSLPIKVKVNKDGEQPIIRNELPSRKRRVRGFEGEWVEETELEGKTIEHKDKVKLEKRPRIVRLHTPYDPFKLNTCHNFTADQPAPFGLMLESVAAVTMDVHAHMAKTEVIGLLGGTYVPQEDQVSVTVAVPCESLSTGMQCEMDPVSQSEACEAIQQQGHSVVGWYHSHPTFTPDPSCRDIETQQKYQDWFGKGGSPFIGVIVSPYCQGHDDPRSIIRCMVVHNKPPQNIALPYQFEYHLTHTKWDTIAFKHQVSDLAERYCVYPNRVHLLQRFTSRSPLTCLQKLIESLSYSFPDLPQEDRKDLCQMVEEIIKSSYSANIDKENELLDDDEEDSSLGITEDAKSADGCNTDTNTNILAHISNDI